MKKENLRTKFQFMELFLFKNYINCDNIYNMKTNNLFFGYTKGVMILRFKNEVPPLISKIMVVSHFTCLWNN